MAESARGHSKRSKANRLPIALQKILSGPVSLPPFDYTPEQWSKIEGSIRPLQPTSDAIDDIRYRLCQAANSYLFQEFKRPDEQKRRRSTLKSWSCVETHASRLVSEFKRLQGEDDGFPRSSEFYESKLNALFDIRVRANSRIVNLAGKIDDGFPTITPKASYQSVVLEEWVALGGALRFSRHPVKGKIKGPLVEYFSAVTQPVYGGSPETLPDTIRRHRDNQAAIVKWGICMSAIGFSTPAVRRALFGAHRNVQRI